MNKKQRPLPNIPIHLLNGQEIDPSTMGQNELIRDIIVKLCPRYTPGGILLYISDTSEKFIVNEAQALADMGIDPNGKLPDVLVYYQEKDWLVIIEAVTSHGPVDLKQHNELKKLFKPSQKGLVFVTAFPDRSRMTKYLTAIAWETEVWLADKPDHLIHFNGEILLDPY